MANSMNRLFPCLGIESGPANSCISIISFAIKVMFGTLEDRMWMRNYSYSLSLMSLDHNYILFLLRF